MKEDHSDNFIKPVDGIDLSSLRLNQDYAKMMGLKRIPLSIPARKPDKQWFIQCHPDSSYRLETMILESRDEKEIYLVEQPLWSELENELTPCLLLTSITKQGIIFIWPIKLPGIDGKMTSWSQSALDAAKRALKNWIRLIPVMAIGGYEIMTATAELERPTWPDMTFEEIITLAFKNRIIKDMKHPIIRMLRGEE